MDLRESAVLGEKMKLYEPFSLAFLVITLLILAFSSELGVVLLTQNERDCHRTNSLLLEEGREGPLRRC